MMSVKNPNLNEDDDETGETGDHDYMGQQNPMYSNGKTLFNIENLN